MMESSEPNVRWTSVMERNSIWYRGGVFVPSYFEFNAKFIKMIKSHRFCLPSLLLKYDFHTLTVRHCPVKLTEHFVAPSGGKLHMFLSSSSLNSFKLICLYAEHFRKEFICTPLINLTKVVVQKPKKLWIIKNMTLWRGFMTFSLRSIYSCTASLFWFFYSFRHRHF